MVTVAEWLDYDGDGDPDLLVAGDWMPLRLFANDGGTLTEVSAAAGLGETQGFWNALSVADVDNDGDPDLIAGNWGMNTRIRATSDAPARLYAGDFDGNGKIEQLITTFHDGGTYPLVMRTDLVSQLPQLRKKYLYFRNYRRQRVEDVLTAEALEAATTLSAVTTESVCYLNDNGVFRARTVTDRRRSCPRYSPRWRRTSTATVPLTCYSAATFTGPSRKWVFTTRAAACSCTETATGRSPRYRRYDPAFFWTARFGISNLYALGSAA